MSKRPNLIASLWLSSQVFLMLIGGMGHLYASIITFTPKMYLVLSQYALIFFLIFVEIKFARNWFFLFPLDKTNNEYFKERCYYTAALCLLISICCKQ